MKLQGSTKIELTDVRTGKVQTIEKHNLITNNAAGLFNWLGGYTDMSNVVCAGSLSTGITSLFGGLLLLDAPQGTDPDRCFADKSCRVVGTARYNTQNNGSNVSRGDCNITETVIDSNERMAKFVYDFATSQANGNIASVCLCPAPGAAYSEDKNQGEAGVSDRATWTFGLWGYGGNWFPLGSYPNYSSVEGSLVNKGAVLEWDVEKGELLTGRLDFARQALILTWYAAPMRTHSLFDATGPNRAMRVLRSHTVDMTGKMRTSGTGTPRYTQNSSLRYDEELRRVYVVCTAAEPIAAGGSFTVTELDLATMRERTVTIHNTTGVSLSSVVSQYWYLGGSNYASDTGNQMNGTVYEGWVYMVSNATGSGYRMFRFALDNPTNVEEIETCGEMPQANDCYGGRIYYYNTGKKGLVIHTEKGRMYHNEVCITDSDINNGMDVTRPMAIYPYHGLHLAGPGKYAVSGAGAAGAVAYPVLRPNLLSTINDLASPVQKTADQTMKITYILREAADSDPAEKQN